MHARSLALILIACVLPLSACARDSGEREVRDTLRTFADATARKDYQRLCDDLFSEKLVEEVRQTVPCEVALKNSSLEEARNPKLEVRSVKIDGDTATAVVRTTAANQPASQDTVRLVRERKQWRIAALAS